MHAQRLQMRLYIPWTDRDLALFRDFLSGFPVIPKFHLYGRRNSFLLAFSFSNKINDIFKKHVSTVLMSSSILNNTKYKGEFEVCNINKYYFISDFVIKNGTGRDPR